MRSPNGAGQAVASESGWEQRLLRNPSRKIDLRPEYQELKFTLHRKLLDQINLDALAGIENDRIRAEVKQAALTIVEQEPTLLTASEKEQISEEVLHEVFGLGPLEPLLQDPTISDILVNGYQQVYVERAGVLHSTNVRFHDNAHLLRIIDRIVSQVGRRVDESNPMVDARLLDGSRVNAIIPPLAVDGPLLSIRRFGTDRLMPSDLVDRLSLTAGMMQLLEAAVKAKLNIIVSGGTGAGKTTLLNALSAFISPRDRIVTIEDAAELQLKQPHLARLETRPANVEGNGTVRQRQLLVNALRMRPDRIIVGEVRGEEALDMLQAMNTGHDGSLTTVHANTPRDAVSRLEVMVSLANANMHVTAIRQQIASAVNIIVQISRMSDGTRRVMKITEVTGMETDTVTIQDIFVFEKLGLSPEGKVLGRFAATGILPKFNEKLVAAGIHLPVGLFDEVVEVGTPCS
jgi:pilus assembly protein CpaF